MGMSVFASGLVNLLLTIESYGIDPAPLFAAEEINIQFPVDPSLRIPFKKMDSIWAEVRKLCDDEAIGLRSAECYSISQFGALGYAWQASSTLRSAFERMKRFVHLVNDDLVIRIEDRDDCMVVTASLNVSSESEASIVDRGLGLFTKMCRMVYGEQFRLESINFKHEGPLDIKPYFEFFGCKLNFNQADNQLLIHQSIADKVLLGADPEMAMLTDQVLTRRLVQIDKSDIVARVQAVFVDQLSLGDVNDDSVAEALHMSVRTLHRKLADVNSSFRAVLVETRRKLADQYIMDSSLTLTEITFLLGFSEQSSFSRAFKTWTGSTPTELRQARLGHQ